MNNERQTGQIKVPRGQSSREDRLRSMLILLIFQIAVGSIELPMIIIQWSHASRTRQAIEAGLVLTMARKIQHFVFRLR